MKALFKTLASIFLLIILMACQRGEPEIVIVPEGYTGYVIIIYNQDNGAPVRYEGEKRVYEIPESGILRTQFSGNYGWVGFTEFYYDSIAPENRISYVPNRYDSENLASDSIVASGGSTGNANRDLAGKEVVSYAKYFIGTEAQSKRAYEDAAKLNIIELADE